MARGVMEVLPQLAACSLQADSLRNEGRSGTVHAVYQTQENIFRGAPTQRDIVKYV